MTVRLGVLSFAHGHVNVYCGVIAGFDDAEVVAAWDDDAGRGRAACAGFGIEFVEDRAALLARKDIDAVFVASPTNQHADHCIAAAEAAKGILLQKPMALSLDDCDRIIDAVDRSSVPFSLLWQMRCDPANHAMKRLVEEGAVGQVATAHRRHGIPALLSPEFAKPGNWHIDPDQNMGMFMDDASHAADWFLWMFGMPVSVLAEIDNIVTDAAPDDNGTALYRFAAGQLGILENSSTQLAAEATTEIFGDAGTIVHYHGDAPSSTFPRPAGAASVKVFRKGAPDWEAVEGLDVTRGHGERIQALPRQAVDYLSGRRGPIATAREGRQSTEMILGAYEAARTGRRVTFPTERGPAADDPGVVLVAIVDSIRPDHLSC